MDTNNNDDDVDVISLPSTCKSLKTFTENLKILCKTASEIQYMITSGLSKTSFEGVDASQMVGKGSQKVSKEYLADTVIKLVRLIEPINSVVNSDVQNFLASSPPETKTNEVNELKTYLHSMQTRLDDYDENMKLHQAKLESMVSSITDLVSSSVISNVCSSDTPPPNTVSPHARTATPPCEPYVKYAKDAVPESMQESLNKFISEGITQGGAVVHAILWYVPL